MGPRNVRGIKTKLRDIALALGSCRAPAGVLNCLRLAPGKAKQLPQCLITLMLWVPIEVFCPLVPLLPP